jgi:hypothetical protein
MGVAINCGAVEGSGPGHSCVYRKLRLARIDDAVRRGAPVT